MRLSKQDLIRSAGFVCAPWQKYKKKKKKTLSLPVQASSRQGRSGPAAPLCFLLSQFLVYLPSLHLVGEKKSCLDYAMSLGVLGLSSKRWKWTSLFIAFITLACPQCQRVFTPSPPPVLL